VKGKRNVLAAVALAAAFAFADDGYLVVGHGGLMEKGGDSPIAKELVARFSPKNGTAVAVDVVEVTNAVALKACAPKSYAGIILVPGFDTGKMKVRYRRSHRMNCVDSVIFFLSSNAHALPHLDRPRARCR